jgi:aryl carrier-like protein
VASRAPGRVPGEARAVWSVHCRGLLRRAERTEEPARLDLGALRARLGASAPAAVLHAALRAMGLEHGPAFQGLAERWQGEGEALGRVRLPEAAGAATPYRLHPALLDACLQLMNALSLHGDEAVLWEPAEVMSLRLWQPPTGELWCHVRAGREALAPSDRRSFELQVADATGALVVELSGRARRIAMPTTTIEPLLERFTREPPGQRAALLRGWLRGEIARVLRLAESELDDDAALIRLGMDSLMGLELRYRLKRGTAVDIPMTQLLRDMTVGRLAQLLLDQLPARAGHSAFAPPSDTWVDLKL